MYFILGNISISLCSCKINCDYIIYDEAVIIWWHFHAKHDGKVVNSLLQIKLEMQYSNRN